MNWNRLPHRCSGCLRCVACGQVQGLKQFAGLSENCNDCVKKAKWAKQSCVACNRELPAEAFTATTKESNRKHGTPLICIGCRQAGCTSHDRGLYECQQCKKRVGAQRFEKKQLENFKARGSRLVCTQCEAATSDRLAKLARLVRQSKIRCTCKKPIHTAKCPLTPLSAGQVRWPGMDTGVSNDDRAFLQRHKPSWWCERLGRFG